MTKGEDEWMDGWEGEAGERERAEDRATGSVSGKKMSGWGLGR